MQIKWRLILTIINKRIQNEKFPNSNKTDPQPFFLAQ